MNYKVLLECVSYSGVFYLIALFGVHDLNSFIDHVQIQGGHSFGEDTRGAGFISVLPLSKTNTHTQTNRGEKQLMTKKNRKKKTKV